MIWKRIFPLIVGLTCITGVLAQETGEDDLGSWFMYFGTNRLSDRLSLHTEAQLRTYRFGSNFNQLLLRTGLNYHLSEKAILTIGYAWIGTDTSFEEPPSEKDLRENRIFQQFVLNNKLGALGFSHRYRLEQRFLERSGHPDATRTEYRARYLLRLTYPLVNKWYITFYDEIFINLQEPLFGQNRLYGALGYQLGNKVKLEVGYLKNHFTGINFDRFQVGIWWDTDLRIKKDGSG